MYRLSDVEVVNRIKTDIAFRWFLGLSINDSAPDDTTISHFRVKRLGEMHFDEFSNEIVKQCIENDLIGTKWYIIDSTDVAANVNYPSEKILIRNAFKNVIKEVAKFDEPLAKEQMEKFENDLELEYSTSESVNSRTHFLIADKYLAELYTKTYDELQNNDNLIRTPCVVVTIL